jgi:hypothetical protein
MVLDDKAVMIVKTPSEVHIKERRKLILHSFRNMTNTECSFSTATQCNTKDILDNDAIALEKNEVKKLHD